MPKVKVNDITMNYEQQGTGEPLVLIPYLAADNILPLCGKIHRLRRCGAVSSPLEMIDLLNLSAPGAFSWL
jgi:hypothetical protein